MRALLLTGSLGRGEGDELSDLDLVIVAEPGQFDELWAERRAIAEKLGRVLGLFRDLPSADPSLAIAIYDGPLKADLFFREGAVDDSPWLADGFTVLVDKAGGSATPPPAEVERRFDAFHADLVEFDAHAWDFALWLWTKLRRNEPWLVYARLAVFLETIVLTAWSDVATGQPWRGATGAQRRLPPEVSTRLQEALPRSAEASELLRALRAQVSLYAEARAELARREGTELSPELMAQIRHRIGC